MAIANEKEEKGGGEKSREGKKRPIEIVQIKAQTTVTNGKGRQRRRQRSKKKRGRFTKFLVILNRTLFFFLGGGEEGIREKVKSPDIGQILGRLQREEKKKKS